jgi:hypothetical protein
MYATASEVAAWLGQETPTDNVVLRQWNMWLAQVEAIILARVPNLEALVAVEEINPNVVANVQAAAVARMVATSDGVAKRETSVKIDDGTDSESLTYATWIIPGKLYLTDDEWELLLPEPKVAAFSITLGHPYHGQGLQ